MITDQKPPEYIQKKALFCGQEFYVNRNVLIPRLETEEIIEFCPPLVSGAIADVGCGCGCIGITLSKKFPSAKVYLSDVSSKALTVAKKNATNQIILKSDLFESYPKKLKFDLIVANLPYVPTKRIQKLSGSVKNFEPHLALDGGPNGTAIINRLLARLPLKPGGLAILEIDDTHTLNKFKIPKSKFQAKILKDQFGRNRFLVLHSNIV